MNIVKCNYCGKNITKNHPIIQRYPEILYECDCGTIVNEVGKDRTDEYYGDDIK